MNKTIICGIPMKDRVDLSVYSSDDKSIPVSDRAVRFPINAFLEKTLHADDSLKIILLVKKDAYGHYENNCDYFKEELADINASIGASVKYREIDTDFSEAKAVHEQLMGKLVDEIDEGTHILVDTTYGPKDMPVIIFAALNFAEKFLNCQIDNIVYGQASFVNGKAVDTKICDMIPLYCLSSITNTIRSVEPGKAKTMVKTLLSM